MKKSVFLALAIASVAFASCSKEASVLNSDGTKTVAFSLSENETKTAFGTKDGNKYPVLWTENDAKVKVSNSYDSAKDASVTVSSDKKTAKFSVELTQKEEANNLSVLSPSTSYVAVSSDYSSWTITIPSSQTPTSTSVDEAAMVLYGYKEVGATLPESIDIAMHHVTSYGCLSFKNLNLSGATISSVSIETDANITNRFYFYPVSNTMTVNSGSKSVTLTTTGYENLWFAVAPCSVTKFKFTVFTSKGNYTKEVTASKEFIAGHVTPISVDMTGVSPVAPKVFTKLTDVSKLAAGDYIIIGSTVSNKTYVMSSTQNTSNRGKVDATVNDSKITETTSMEVFAVEAGTETDSWAFKATKNAGYIYAAGGSGKNNWLKTQNTKDANASWSVTIASGVTDIKSVGGALRNVLMYNSTNSIFACYASGQKAVDIYYYHPE